MGIFIVAQYCRTGYGTVLAILSFGGGSQDEKSGTHSELVDRENGLYAEMYKKQAVFYQEGIVIVDSVECCVLALVIFPMTIQDGWKGSYGARRPLSEEECMKMKEKLFDELSAFGTKYGYRSKNSTSSIRGLIAKSQFSFRLNCDKN